MRKNPPGWAFKKQCFCNCHLTSAPTIQTSVLTYGTIQMQTTYLLTYLLT